MTVLAPSPYGVVGGAVTRGRASPVMSSGTSFGVCRFTSDPVGVFTLRFRNLVAGSRVRVEAADTAEQFDEFIASGDSTQLRSLLLFPSGNPRNDLRIKVRKASESPAYRPFESQATAQLGTVTVYVFQEPDE